MHFTVVLGQKDLILGISFLCIILEILRIENMFMYRWTGGAGKKREETHVNFYASV